MENQDKKKSWFKIPPSIVIILSIFFFVIVLSWVLQGQSVSTNRDFGDTIFGIVVPQVTYTVQAIGLLSVGNLFIQGFADAAGIIFYLFVLGWFLNLLMESGTLEEGVKILIRGTKNKELILVPLMFLIFAFAGTAFGMQEETLGLFIIVIPFFILAGFDNVTGLLVILLGTTTGIAASLVDPFSVASAYDAIPGSVGEYDISDGIIFRTFLFALFASIGVTFVTIYAYRVQKNPEKSLTSSDSEENIKWAKSKFDHEDIYSSKTHKKHKWGLIVFSVSFLLMFLFLIPWYSFFGMDSSVGLWDKDGLSPWISWLLAGMNPIGSWGFGELIVLFAISSLILGYGVYKMNTKEVVNSFFEGAKDMLMVSILIAIARSIPAALAQSQLDYYFALNIANQLEGIGQLGWTYSMFFIFGAFAFFVPSTTGLASATMGIFSQSAAGLFSGDQLDSVIISTVIAYVIAVGIINMLTPTQAVVMASAEKSKVPYLTMLKPVSLYAFILMMVTITIVLPATLLI